MPKNNHFGALLEAGLTNFHGRGYNATSVQDIVQLAESPKGSFYNHFESKEGLAIAVIDLYWNKAEQAREVLNDDTLPVPERIDRHFQALGCPEEGCLIGNLTAELAGLDPFRTHLAEIWRRWINILENCLLAGQQVGTVGIEFTPAELAQFVLTQWEGALLAFRVERDPDILLNARRLIQKVIKP